MVIIQFKMNSDFLLMQDFIKKTVKETVQSQNTHFNNLLQDISSKLSEINQEKTEENFKEYRDTLLEISLKEFDKIGPTLPMEQINIIIRRWVGTLFDKLAKASFSGYFQGLLLEQELKVYFSRNLINNFINFIECFQAKTSYRWADLSKDIIKSFEIHSKSALNFLMSKYPQKTSSDPDFYLSEMIPETEEKQVNPVYDVIATSGYTFSYSENGRYEHQIKSFLNILIEETKKKREKFMTEIRSTFKIFKQNSDETEEVPNSVGSKLAQTTKMFTQEEINAPGIDIKSSDILRVIIKWIEYIYDDIQNSKLNIGQRITGFIRKGKFLPQVNQNSNQQLIPIIDLGLSTRQKNQLATGVESEFKEKIIEVQHESNQKQNSLLSSLTKFISKNRQTFQYIDIVEFRTSLFSHIVSESVSNLATSFLSHLIHILKRTINTVGKIDGDLADISLLRFGVMDLLRAKCEGTRDQIIKVYNNIKNNPEFKIIRVKNRLKTGNKDFLINLQYKQSFLLCQLQLYVKTAGDSDKKQCNLQHFSHFLYQLERSRYGSLSEAAIICSNLYNPVSYFRKTLVELNDKELVQHKAHYLHPEYSNSTFYSQKFINNKNDFSFICHSCYRYFNAYSTFLDVLTHQDSKENICGECILELLGEEKSTQCILGDKMGPYFKRINMNNYKFEEQDYLIIVNKSYMRKLKALKYYSCYEFFSTVFSDHHSIRFYELKDVKQLAKNSYVFILNKEKLKLLPEIKMETLLIKQIKQMVSLSLFIEEDAVSIRSESNQEKNVPIIPINQDVNLVNKEEYVICYSYEGNSILVIDSVGENNPIDSYLQTKRHNILQQHLKSKVDTWVAEDLMLSSIHLQQIIDKNPGLVIRRIRFENNLFKNFNIKLRDLEELNLKFNKFEKLNFDDIPLYSLQTLDLSFNQIQQVVNSSSIYLYNLQNLNISNNYIKTFSLNNGALPYLTKLNISNNPIHKLEISQGYEFKNLTHFEMEQTLVKSLNLSNVSLPKLKTLLLRKNDILEQIILPTLQKIESIDANKSPSLKHIKFNNYFVREIKSINLSNCNFAKAPTGYQFPDLEKLNISCNKLTSLDLSKAYLVALKELNASSNKISHIQLSKHSKCLEKLYLQKNHIKKIEIQSIGLNRLVEINLEQNVIQNFYLNPSMTLKKLQLKLNPGKISSLLNIDSTQVPFLQYLSLGVNKKTKSYVEWIYQNLPKQEQEKFKFRVLQANQPSLYKTINMLESNSLPQNFNQLKYFLKIIRKLDLPFSITQKEHDISKHVTNLFKSAMYNEDYTQFYISPLMNTLNLQYDENKLKQNKETYSPKDSIKKTPSTLSTNNNPNDNISNSLANIFLQSINQQQHQKQKLANPNTNQSSHTTSNNNNPMGNSSNTNANNNNISPQNAQLNNTLNFERWNNYHQSNNYSFNGNQNSAHQSSQNNEPDFIKSCSPSQLNYPQNYPQNPQSNYQQNFSPNYPPYSVPNMPTFSPNYYQTYPQGYQQYYNQVPNYQNYGQIPPSSFIARPTYYVQQPDRVNQSPLKSYPRFNQLYSQQQNPQPPKPSTSQIKPQPQKQSPTKRVPHVELTKSTSSVSLPPQNANHRPMEPKRQYLHKQTISESLGSKVTKKKIKRKRQIDQQKRLSTDPFMKIQQDNQV